MFNSQGPVTENEMVINREKVGGGNKKNVKIKFSTDTVRDNWKRVRFKYYAFESNFSL